MNPDALHADGAGPREPWEEWSALDDTLADAPVDAVPAAARPWLADQRFVHGLLRAMHLADVQAREARIAEILAAAMPAAGTRSARSWWLVAAAALLLCAVAGVLWLPGRLPSADAAVLRAAELLGQDVDRRFVLAASFVVTTGHEPLHHELDLELTTRPGMHLLVTGSVPFGPMRLDDVRGGCDGVEVWVQPQQRLFWRAWPLADAQRLLAGMGDVLDLGYLDVHALVERLPKTFALRAVARERDVSGRSVLRIEATGAPRRPDVKLRRALLWVDEDTGMVTRIEVAAEGPRGTAHLKFEYQGVVQLDAGAYRRPW